MRALLIHPELSNRGGAQLLLTWLTDGLRKAGHEVEVLTAAEIQGRRPIEAGEHWEYDVLRRGAEGRDVVVAGNFPASLWVGEAKKKHHDFPPAVWWCNEPSRWLYEKTLSSHFRKSPLDPRIRFPWTSMLRERRLSKWISRDRDAVSAFDKIFAISAQTARWIKTIYHRHAEIVNPGVGDMSLQDPYYSQEVFTLLSPAGLEPIKNYETVIKAFRLFRSSVAPSSRLKLVMTGDGQWKEAATDLAAKLQLTAHIEFRGWLTREALFGCYRESHAVVFIPLDEPFGLVALEAGLAGKPVIASSHGGPSEVVLDQETGLLVNPMNVQEAANAMKRLYENRDETMAMGRKMQKRVSENYSFDHYLREMEKYLR